MMHCLQDMKLFRACALLPAALLLGAAARTEPALPPRVVDSYGKLPLSFEANRGQTAPQVKFLARGPGYTLFLTADAAVLSLARQKTNAVLRMRLQGANARASVTGADALPGKSNYFIGSDPSQWRTNVPTYAAVKYAAVYPGIDLVYHGNQRLLEYDFLVAPGADPQAIGIRFQGARKLTVNRDGALVIGLGGSEVIEPAPVVYQEIGGRRQAVAGRYVLRGRGRVGFSVPEYDRSQALVIDPTLVYSTYLGGSGGDSASGIAVDASGNAYVAGNTGSSDFPTTPGAFQTTYDVGGDVFVTKLNAAGSALVYSTYLGVSDTGWAFGNAIAVDVSGNAYVAGSTTSSNFPTTPGAFQTTSGGGPYKAYVTKLNATGSALVYSTYLGGSGDDEGNGIAVDALGSAYVTGDTASFNFPTTPGAFQTALLGSQAAFVTKLNTAGSAPVYSTYLGGSGWAGGTAIAVDVSGNAYVTGTATSPDFPTTPGALQTAYGGASETFVTKLNAAGSALVYSTFLGGSNGNSNGSSGIAVDASDNAYVTGSTYSSNFPTTPGAFQTAYGGAWDVFVAKLNATGSALAYSTYLGGSAFDYGEGIAVDASGNAYVTGATPGGFPITPGAFQTGYGGGQFDAFVSKLNASGSVLLYSTYLGGSGFDWGFGIAVDASGNAYVTGLAESGFPTTPGAFQTTMGINFVAFVSKLSLGSFVSPGPVTTANLNGPSGTNGWYVGAVTVTLVATPGSSPVSATYYSVDGGPFLGYGAPFQIPTDGVHQLMFYSVDTAGDQETPHGQTVKIDTTKPVSHVTALPATATTPNFSVQWSGTDATSGVSNYTIYVSDNGGPFAPWLSNVTSTQAYYTGSLLHTYGFYSIATDNAGNVENPKTAAEATTYVPQMRGDVNGDGKINCADIALVKAAFGTRTGQPGFNPSADVNHDGVVNVLDLAIVSQKLASGTKCP